MVVKLLHPETADYLTYMYNVWFKVDLNVDLGPK